MNFTYVSNILEEQFYRVQISVQSPEGVTTMRGVLRRFNDFLKLLTDVRIIISLSNSLFFFHFSRILINCNVLDGICTFMSSFQLKREFPRKSFPSAPPKGLLRMKSRALLEEVCSFPGTN